MEPLEPSEQLESLLAGYVLGDLSPEEVARVKQLLEGDPAIAAEVDRLQSTLALLPLSLPSETLPPKQLQSKILQVAQSDVTSQVNVANAHLTQRSIRQRRWVVTVGSIAATTIVALGIQIYQLQQKLAVARSQNLQLQQNLKIAQANLSQLRQHDVVNSQELSRYQQAVDLLRQPNSRFLNLKGTSQPATGSLLIAPKTDKALLALRDVAPLPQGKVYRMWAIVNGRKVSCTDFKPNAKGKVFLEIPLDQWGAATEVVVTVEPDRYMPQPIGEMVITGS